MPDSANFVDIRDTRFAFSLAETSERQILHFWFPPGWPDEVNSRGVEPKVMVVRQALLAYGQRFGVIGDGQVRYGQPED